MRKRPFLIFFAAVALLVASALAFIQSKSFAGIFKKVISQYLPKDMGIDSDFSEFAIKIYPPGLSLKNPKITLRERNILEMPAGSSVTAERIDLVFRPLQMFSGNVRVHELVIVGGDLHLLVEPQAEGKGKKASLSKRPFSMNFHWDELFQIRAEAIVIQDSRARVDWTGTNDSVELQVKNLKFGQWLGRGGLGYEFSTELTGLGGSVVEDLPALKSLQRLEASAHVNALGIQIDAIHVKGSGYETQGNGMIRGNLQKPKDGLNLDADLSADADIGTISQFMHASGSVLEASGNATFKGRVRGNLMKTLETLRLQGDFSAKNFQFRKFRADEIQASGTWNCSPRGGEIDFEKALIQAHDQLRAPGQPSSGGKIRVGSLKMKLDSADPIAVKLDLERADVQWLAALGLSDLKTVFPVLFKASGPIEAQITPPTHKRALQLQAQVKLKIEDFVLDNQKLTERKPMQRVFKIPRIDVEGPIAMNAQGLQGDGLVLSLPHSKLQVEGGISFKNGFNLKASGVADFSDLGEVAENEIRGQGNVEAYVHGPAKNLLIDLDLDVKNAYYIRLNFGDLKGRITWDDDPSHLLFHRIRAEKGSTQYRFDGMLDLGKANSVSLDAEIPKGNVQEFLQIFGELTKDLWWFPQSLSGPFSGSLKVGGGIKLNELQVTGDMAGNSWDYLGERFGKVALHAAYDRGKYSISNFHATKRQGRMSGRISFDTSDVLDWDFHTQQMTVSDLDHVAQLDVPIRGRIQVDSTGKGKIGAIQSSTSSKLTDFLVRGSPMPSSGFFLESSGGVHKVKGTVFGGQGSFEGSYDFNPLRSSHLRADFRHLDFSPALLLLNPKNIGDPMLSGFVSGSINLDFRSGQIERSDGEMVLSEYSLAKSDVKFRLDEPVSFKITDGSFDLKTLSVIAYGNNQSQRSQAKLSLKARQAQLDGQITGDVDTSIVEFVTSAVPRALGVADLDFKLSGTVKQPSLLGEAKLKGVNIWVQGLESPFENVSGTFQVKQNAIYVQNFLGDLAGGRASAGGTILLFADRYPLISLKAQLSGNKLRFFPFQYAKLAGSLSVTGDHLPYLVEGKFNLESALSKEKVFQQKQTHGLKSSQYTPPPSAQRLSDYPKFKLKIDVNADRGIIVQNDLFDAEFKGKMTVVNTIEAPRLLGSGELVQGRMIFKDRIFQIQSASALFDNPTVINPKFTLTAKTDVNGVKVQIYTAGALNDFKIELSSTPLMSETDILSLLAIGISPSDSRRMSSTNQSTLESGEAASLLLHSLDFNREVQDKTGIQIQLDESVNSQIGTSVFKPQSPTENAAAPKIIIKKRLSKNFDLSYGSTVGTGTSSEREVNAEMKVTPGFSVIGVWDNYEATDTTQSKTSNYSYGLDFKLQKRFK